MRRILLSLALLIAIASASADEPSFFSSLAADELKQTGLDGLRPDQIARLNALVERFTRGEVSRNVTEVIEEKEDKEALENPRKGPKLVESRILGRFQGWGSGTIFRLENGQMWQVANLESFKGNNAVENPEAVLKRSRIGGYWMYVDGFPGVRVRRIQ